MSNKVSKRQILNWILKRYENGELNFRAIPYDNANIQYWFKDDENSISVFLERSSGINLFI